MGRRATTAVAGMLVFGALAGARAGASQTAEPSPETVYLSSAAHGASAIRRLGDELDAVADVNDMSTDELEATLLEDPSLWIDRTGHAIYVDPPVAARPKTTATAAAAAPSTDRGPYPYGDTFTLHSRPGASTRIFLDFDGHTIENTGWNTRYSLGASYTAPAFSIDLDDTTFSNSERDTIQSVFQRVSEDFAPFDVDVTTEQPSVAALLRSDGSDQEYGMRVVITNSSLIATRCGCAGTAYLGAFDMTSNHAAFQPVLVTTYNTGNAAKAIADTVSHEVGHTFGLSHDGTTSQDYYAGHNPYTPIMGSPSFYAIVQWSIGEYNNANNHEDDVAIIAQHGAPLIADDHGGTTATATQLGTTYPVSATGLIGTRTDVDMFGIDVGAGAVTVTVTGFSAAPNLDVELRLLDDSGALIQTVDPAAGQTTKDIPTGMGATLSTTLTAGHYNLRIDGVGVGTTATGYSDYGSLGRYTVAVTAVNGPPPTTTTTTTTTTTIPTTTSTTTTTTSSTTTTSTTTTTLAPSTTAPRPGHTNGKPSAKVEQITVAKGAPVTVSFDATGSKDRDGTILTYQWDFGDDSPTGSGSTTTHTYTEPGTYSAVLTIMDDGGATATAKARVKVSRAILVDSITTSTVTANNVKTPRATVRVVDGDGVPVKGAKVTGKWTGARTGTASGTTAADGTVVLKGPAGTGSYTFTVSRLSLTNAIYVAEDNEVSSATVIVS